MSQVEESLGAWQEAAGGLARRGEELTAMHRAMSMLKEAEVNPGHRLHTLLDIYTQQKNIENGMMAARQQVIIFTGECEKMTVLHQRALSSISGPQLAKWGQEMSALLEHVMSRGASSAASITSFLENAGQRELLCQYQSTESDLVNCIRRLVEETRVALEQLNMYHAITSLYPGQARSQHRVNMYSVWGNTLLENTDTTTCDNIAAEFANLFSVQPTRVREMKTGHVLGVNHQLESWNQEMMTRIQRLYQRMMSEGVMKQVNTCFLLADTK